jgi:hypothetical protein
MNTVEWMKFNTWIEMWYEDGCNLSNWNFILCCSYFQWYASIKISFLLGQFNSTWVKAYNIVSNSSLCCRMGMFINQNFIYLSCHSMTFIRDLPHWFLQSSHIIGHPMYLNKIDPSIDIYIHPHSSNKFHRVELVLDIMLLSYLFAWHLFIKCSHIHLMDC